MRLRNLRRSGPGRVAVAGALVAVLAVAGWTSASSTAGRDTAVGQPPPEWAANTDGWPAHNHDLSNTRATTRSAISSETVSHLAPTWRFPFKAVSAFGAFASAPIVLGDRVYLQDLDSNVYAINRSSGKLEWRHMFNAPSIGPNGVAYGYGRLYGATETTAFALDPKTGE